MSSRLNPAAPVWTPSHSSVQSPTQSHASQSHSDSTRDVASQTSPSPSPAHDQLQFQPYQEFYPQQSYHAQQPYEPMYYAPADHAPQYPYYYPAQHEYDGRYLHEQFRHMHIAAEDQPFAYQMEEVEGLRSAEWYVGQWQGQVQEWQAGMGYGMDVMNGANGGAWAEGAGQKKKKKKKNKSKKKRNGKGKKSEDGEKDTEDANGSKEVNGTKTKKNKKNKKDAKSAQPTKSSTTPQPMTFAKALSTPNSATDSAAEKHADKKAEQGNRKDSATLSLPPIVEE